MTEQISWRVLALTIGGTEPLDPHKLQDPLHPRLERIGCKFGKLRAEARVVEYGSVTFHRQSFQRHSDLNAVPVNDG